MQPTTLIIIGITGDLSKRKLLPAIAEIMKAKAAPEDFKVVGITRSEASVDDVLDGVKERELLARHLEMHQMDLTLLEDYKKLSLYLDDLQPEAQKLFYLSIPPQISLPVVELLGESGIANDKNTKLLLEKPFGTDLDSARELVEHATKHFSEEQIYRIDHYLAKEMTQNLVVFRQNNSLFKRTWNKDFIESIEIVASEKIGIEGRAAFYEQTGALRDIIQSHLLQLTALTLADLSGHDWQAIPGERLKALRALKAPDDVLAQVKRGQYEGYQEEVNNPHTVVETFVSLTLFSDDPNWEGVPIRLVTGKALQEKATEIRVTYKQERADEANMLTLRVQPNEGVELDLWVKKPGYERELQKLPLSYTYEQHFEQLPEAYERVFVDAIRSDRSLFTTSDEVLETWRILEPIQKKWDMTSDDLNIYKKGADLDSLI